MIVDRQRVLDFSGIALNSLNSAFISLADRHIKNILGKDFDGGILTSEEYIDLVQRNLFYVSYDGPRNVNLEKTPIVSFTSLTRNPLETNPTTLVQDEDYFINLEAGIITFSDSLELISGLKVLKATYTYGYSSVPEDVEDYASMMCAMLHEGSTINAKNDAGAILKEIEIGRYRESYGNTSAYLKEKYSLLDSMREELVQKYKWGVE